MNYINVILIFSIISASLHIYYDHKKKYSLTYIFKPLTIVLIIFAAIIGPNYFSLEYKYYIIAGLTFSLVGDVFLMFKKSNYFLQGLGAFLVAHVMYILAIYVEVGFFLNYILLVPVSLYILFLLKYILPGSGNKKLYLIIYASTIGFLIWQAISLITFSLHPQIFLIVSGIIFFAISDSILAFNKFTKKVNYAQIKILGSYYIAQILIMLSI